MMQNVFSFPFYLKTCSICFARIIVLLFLPKILYAQSSDYAYTNYTVKASGIDVPLTPSKLNYNQNNVQLFFTTLDFAHADQMRYRYRINDGLWNITDRRDILLLNLKSGKYSIDIQSENKDRNWSPSTSYNFEITKPWWQSEIFIILIGILALSAFYYYNKRSLIRIKKENDINQQIQDLEKAALQAQMNPHFIFNCLNSIQQFILSNDKEKAMDYLSTFAKLIRQYLKASASSKISLLDERTALKNYIELEQMRFPDKFTYAITLDPNIDDIGQEIPPMLIQPFVENAINHGLKNKKNHEGKLNIQFLKYEKGLRILVQDNGSGFTPSKQKSSTNPHSMDITERRLAHIQKSQNQGYLLDIRSSDQGTVIEILIPNLV